MDDIIIIGSGAAGLTAAVYALRAGKTVRVFEKDTFGGQINFAPSVENFPSIKKISGSEFAANLLDQALELGLETEYSKVSSIEKTAQGSFKVLAEGSEFLAKAIIVATGVKHKKLQVENEERLAGSGVSYCALCDGAFYKGRDVAVAGGGDTAFQEAIFLSKICKTVYLIHRRDAYRAEKIWIDTAKAQPNIKFITSAQITSLQGESHLQEVIYTQDGTSKSVKVDGIFVCVGSLPQNDIFSNIVKLDSFGYADSNEECTSKTNGVFVAGDCRNKGVRQLTTAVADGSVAALAACKYIDSFI